MRALAEQYSRARREQYARERREFHEQRFARLKNDFLGRFMSRIERARVG
jgi:hypothetical protein